NANQGRQRPNRNARARITPKQAFVAFFGIDEDADPTEYQVGIPQVLRLMNSAQFNSAGMLGGIIKATKTQPEAVEKIFLAALARRPRAEEMDRIKVYLNKNKDNPKQALAGVLWVL